MLADVELLNEPEISFQDLVTFYSNASDAISAGNKAGINTTISDGFLLPHTWENYVRVNPSSLRISCAYLR